MIEKILAYLDAEKESHVQRLFELLRVPSISTDPDRKADVRTGADWVHRFFQDCGLTSEIIETPGHACVLADTGPVNGTGPTILVYGHYDVQPVGDESLWHSPAFEPTIRDGAIYARGAADDKGQALTHMLAVESWKRTAGSVPIRVKFIIEGEEEIGSPNLEGIVRQHRDRLACDYVVLSDTPKFDAETPAITYGTKGMIYKEIILQGPKQNLHSGQYGGTITNPGNVLADIVSSLRDADNRVTIPGFYDDVLAITAEEKSTIAELPFDEEAYLEFTGSPALDGEAGFSTIERRWIRPTLDVNGMHGGFVGEGASTVIPAKVMAKVSMRIVPNQNPDTISRAFDKAVRAACPSTLRLEILTHAIAAPYVAPLDSPGMKSAAQAMESGFGVAPRFTREGGTLPILPLFRDVLGADSLMMGFCDPNCNAHGPDEFMGVDDFHAGIRTSAQFLHLLAQSG